MWNPFYPNISLESKTLDKMDRVSSQIFTFTDQIDSIRVECTNAFEIQKRRACVSRKFFSNSDNLAIYISKSFLNTFAIPK